MPLFDIYEEFNNPLGSLFSNNLKWTFLVGAGASMDPPSNLPSARTISQVLLKLCAPEEEVEKLISLAALRYELIVEAIQQQTDRELIFMDYFDEVVEPNFIHIFLASVIQAKNHVVTTNFDYLIERGLMRVLPEKETQYIYPIITKNDFLEHQDPELLIKKGMYPLYKIHGSKTNIITKEQTIESLVTTISDLGKDRESGETFAIEPYKKPLVNNIMRERSLVVLGYSGSDDFDIGPVLKEVPFLERLIWIDHANTDRIEIKKIKKIVDLSDLKHLSKTEQLLLEIRSDVNFNVYLIRAPTGRLFQEIWDLIMPNEEKIYPKNIDEIDKPTKFNVWAKNLYGQIDKKSKYQLAAKLYTELNQFRDAIECAKKGLDSCKMGTEKEDTYAIAYFYGIIGNAASNLGEIEMSLEYHNKSLAIDEKTGDKDGTIASLSGIGYIYYTLAQYDKAFDIFKKAYEIAIEENLARRIYTISTNLGMIYKEWGEFDKAMEYFKIGLQHAEKEGMLNGKATVYSNIGTIYKIQKQYKKALDNYILALEINKQLGYLKGISARLSNIGEIYHMEDKNDLAIQYFNEALAIDEEIGNIVNKDKVMGNIAQVYRANKEYDKALAIYEETLRIAEKLNQQKSISIRLNNIAMIYKEMNELDKALEYSQRALEMDLSINYKPGIAIDYNNLGAIYYKMEDYDNALKYYAQSLDLNEKMGNEEIKEINLVNIRDTYEELGKIRRDEGNFSEAVSYYQKSLEITQNMNDLANQAFYLHAIGKTYYFNDVNDTALEYFQKSLEIEQEINNRQGILDAYYYIAEVHKEENETQLAVEFYKKSLDIAYELENEEDQVLLLEKLATISFSLGNKEDIIVYNEQLIPFYRKEGRLKDIGEIYSGLGNIYAEFGQRERAIEVLKESLEISKQLDSKQFIGNASYGLGYIFEKNKEYKKALPYYQESVKMASLLGDMPQKSARLNRVGLIQKHLGNYSKSIKAFEESISISSDLGNETTLAHRYNALAGVYLRAKEYEKSISNYTISLNLFKKTGQKKNAEIISNNIENVKKKM